MYAVRGTPALVSAIRPNCLANDSNSPAPYSITASCGIQNTIEAGNNVRGGSQFVTKDTPYKLD